MVSPHHCTIPTQSPIKDKGHIKNIHLHADAKILHQNLRTRKDKKAIGYSVHFPRTSNITVTDKIILYLMTNWCLNDRNFFIKLDLGPKGTLVQTECIKLR